MSTKTNYRRQAFNSFDYEDEPLSNLDKKMTKHLDQAFLMDEEETNSCRRTNKDFRAVEEFLSRKY